MRQPPRTGSSARLLFVVEGKHDVEFLSRVSRILHDDNKRVPDLPALERGGRLIFVPFGGGDVLAWASRLANLAQHEVHLYDRELPPETLTRQRAAAIVNARPNCRAFVTGKRALENYLSPEAIYEARGLPTLFFRQRQHPRTGGSP